MITHTKAVGAPPAVKLPPAGGSYIDPVFGTRVFRLTDEKLGRRCTHYYSSTSPFNAGAALVLLAVDGKPHVLPAPGLKGVAKPLATPVAPIQWEGAVWSKFNAPTLFALGSKDGRIYALDVAKGSQGVVKDFGPLDGQPHQLAADARREVFTFHTRSSTGAKLSAYVWDRRIDRLYKFAHSRTGRKVDETAIDKLGQVVRVGLDNSDQALWTPRTDEWRPVRRQVESENGGGHWDLGARAAVNGDGYRTGIIVRDYDGSAPRNILRYLRRDGSLNWTIADHVSLRTDDERWVVGSTYAGDRKWDAFEDEVYLAKLDGSGVLRLAHTRSGEGDYWRQPRATSSRDGRWVLWTTSFGSPDRLDVVVAEVPEGWVP